MGDIIEFKRDDGYNYFAMAILNSLVKGEDGAENLLIQVEDTKGHFHGICGAQLDRKYNTIILQLED